MVFDCQLIHLKNNVFCAILVGHVLAELYIANISIVDALVPPLYAFLAELVRDEVVVIPLLFPISVAVRSTFSDIEVWDGESIKDRLVVLLDLR